MPPVLSSIDPQPRRGPLPRPLAPLALILSRLYSLEINRRNRRFDQGRRVITFDRPVISVGNLSVGGTGKTPMVAHLVRTLLEAGHRPCIAMRGYGSGGGGGGLSDEAEEYRAHFPDVPIVAQPDRARGLVMLFGQQFDEGGPHSDCIILDDGFQHRRIARQMDIVLIDATRSPFEDRLLPAGWLREPVESLKRATHTIITHAQSVLPSKLSALQQQVEGTHGQPPIAITRHTWESLDRSDPANWQAPLSPEPLQFLKGRRLFAACAIGNPGPFLRAAEHAAGIPLVGALALRDHHPYDPHTVERLYQLAKNAGAELVITTAKDWAKLSQVWLGNDIPVVVPRLALAFSAGEDDFNNAVLETIARGVPDDDEAPAEP